MSPSVICTPIYFTPSFYVLIIHIIQENVKNNHTDVYEKTGWRRTVPVNVTKKVERIVSPPSAAARPRHVSGTVSESPTETAGITPAPAATGKPEP